MSTEIVTAAVDRLTAQISDALFGEPGMDLIELSNRCNELRKASGCHLLGESRITDQVTAVNRTPADTGHPAALNALHVGETHGDVPHDVTDPWRGLYLPTRMPAASEYGDLTHPDIPHWPDDREEALDKLVHAQGFDFHIVAGDFTEAALEDGDELYWKELRAWNPEAPEGEWRLAWKGDTEDGPYAWFVRPMALRPDPVALAANGKQQVGEVQRDAWAALEASMPYLETLHSIVGGEARASVWRCIERGRVALAARQPGAQYPVDGDWHLRGYAYASKQATTCAGCGKHKHTPLRIDAMGGYVCLTCIDQKLGALLGEFGYPPAQVIDLAQPAPGVTRYRIEDAPGLDPVTVYVENYTPGKGRMVVTCYASAWTAFWGAMGDDTTLEQFVAGCSPEYVADNMVWGADTKKSTKGYADKVAAAVVAFFKSQRDAAPGVGS